MPPQLMTFSDPFPALRVGDHGPAVSKLRQLLAKCNRNFGQPGIPVGDMFDSQLESIVRIFQYQVFLPQDGIVCAKTWRALRIDGPAHMPTVQLGSVNFAVSQAQRRLSQCDEYAISIDGEFNQTMRDVIVTFQTHQGLKADGVIGPLTWHRLSHGPATWHRSNVFSHEGDYTRSETRQELVRVAANQTAVTTENSELTHELLLHKDLTAFPNFLYSNELILPETIILNEKFNFSLLVKRSEHTKSNHVNARTRERGREGFELEVNVVLRMHECEIHGGRMKSIQIKDSHSSEVSFTITPHRTGEQEIRIDFYQFDRRISTIRQEFKVVE